MISLTGRRTRNKGGFTLIELILTALIISILIGISVPLFRGHFSGLELKNSSYNMAKLISYAQQKAISENRYYRMSLDFKKGRYWLSCSEDLKKFKRVKTKYGKIYLVPSNVKLSGAQDSFVFYPNGSSEKIEIKLSGKKNAYLLKSKGRLGHVEIKPAGEE